jgi:hypothetical protein
MTSSAPSHPAHQALSRLSMLTGFLPWIAFTVIAQRLAADGVAWSALIAVAMTVVALVWGRRHRNPTQLNVYSLGIFTVMAVAGFVGDHRVDEWLFDWGRPLVGVILGLLVLAASRTRPFTAEYARRTTPQELWTSPVFVKINRVLSATWGAALVVMGAAALVVAALNAHPTDTTSPYLVDLLLNWVVPIAVIAWTVRFTNTYPDKVTAGS